MWTPETRALVRDCGAGQALTDDQYRPLEPLIPAAKPGGPRTTDMRCLLDGVCYVVRTGCQWRHSAAASGLPGQPTIPRSKRQQSNASHVHVTFENLAENQPTR
jgi:putative transposase